MAEGRKKRSAGQVQKALARERLAKWLVEPRSIDEIRVFLERHFGRAVPRRTAERYRDWMIDAFGAQARRTATGRKGWVIRRSSGIPAQVAPEQLERCRRAADWLERQGRAAWSAALKDISQQLQASESAGDKAPAETTAVVPTVRVRVLPWVESAILGAIQRNHALRVRYRMSKHSEGTARLGRKLDAVIHPYGIVYGERPFLVGGYDMDRRLARDSKGQRRIGWYALDRFEKIAETTDPLLGRSDFDLGAYVRNWFGTPRGNEEPFDVAWRFSPAVAARAERYEFHPSQRMESQPDGSLIVRFRAAGSLEMHRHLATWGNDVVVLEPATDRFRTMVQAEQARWREYFA